MKTRNWLLLVLAVLVFNAMTGGVESANRADASTISNQSTLSAIDCTAASNACPEITIQGDAPAMLPDGRPSPARGYADPSFRRDPASNTLWLAYSWPHTQVSRGAGGGSNTVTVDSHLVRSDDNGVTWRFVRPLWTATPETDGSGESGYANQETVSLAPRQTPTGTIWYSARLSYFTRLGSNPKLSSFTLRVATATSPENLAQAEEAVLGGDLTAPFWKADFNLDSLSSELAGCTWNDPGILFRDGNLYLAVECMLFDARGESPQKEFVALFATQPNGSVRSWSWHYLGKLSGYAEATELGGENLLQTELTLGQDGVLLATFSPSRPNSPLATHFGCKVVEIASLDPPKLARDSMGHLRVRVSVTASDLLPNGPAACSYESSSSTGLVIVRRRLVPGELVVSLNRTGLRP